MGVKGISWIEQNVEKIVVGVFGVGLLGVIASQFVGGSTSVKLTGLDTKPKDVGIETAMSAVGDRAKQVYERITAPEPRELAEIQEKLPTSAGVQESFTQRMGNVAPRAQLATVIGTPRLKIGGGSADDPSGRQGQSFMYAKVTPPAPEKPVAASFMATVHPVEYLTVPEVAAILPRDPAPKDKASISIETTFDGVALAGLLEADPDADGPLSALPAHWWSADNLQLLSINLERQELLSSGEWSAAAPVAPMPGRPNLVTQMSKVSAGANDAMRALLTEARQQGDAIRKPKYYEIVYGVDWVPPTEAVTLLTADVSESGQSDQTVAARRELDQNTNQIARVQEEIRKLQERPGDPTAPPPPPRGGGGGKGGGGRAPSTDSPSPADPKSRQLKGLEDSLARLVRERERLIEKWRKRGVELEPEANPAAVPVPVEADPKPLEVPELPLLDNNAAKILAHDVTVQRGKTYRYRLSLTLNNPVFGKVVGNTPEQEALQKEPFVTSAASDWSDPVSVDAETYYFITSASSQDAITRGSRAAAEVFIFRWGYWRRGTVSIEPGDLLAADVKVPDLSKQLEMLAAADPAGGQPMPDRGAGGPGGGRGAVGAAPPPGARGGEAEAPAEPEITYLQESVSHDAIFLEVAPTAVLYDIASGKPRLENHVYLQDSDGKIGVRSPDSDRVSESFRRLDFSAKRGDESLRPKVVIPTGLPDPGTGPRGRENEPPPPPPSGGGGSGGG